MYIDRYADYYIFWLILFLNKNWPRLHY